MTFTRLFWTRRRAEQWLRNVNTDQRASSHLVVLIDRGIG